MEKRVKVLLLVVLIVGISIALYFSLRNVGYVPVSPTSEAILSQNVTKAWYLYESERPLPPKQSVPVRGDITLLFDDCGGITSTNCVPWTNEEKKNMTDFLYGPNKTAPDNTLTGAYQIIRSVIGPPYQSGTIKIRHDPTSYYTAYYDGSNIVIKGFSGGVSSADPKKVVLKSLGHELVHAFQGPVYLISSYQEGVARMLEEMVALKLNITSIHDYEGMGIDNYFLSLDQNNDQSLAVTDGNLFNTDVWGLVGNMYSLNGATFYKLYLEDNTFWKRFYDSVDSQFLINSSFFQSAPNLLNLVKTLGPKQVEGVSLNDWLNSMAAFNYTPNIGPDLILRVDNNGFMYIYYIYRNDQGRVSQLVPDASGRLRQIVFDGAGNSPDINVTVKYYDAYGKLLSTDNPTAYGIIFGDPGRLWLSNFPVKSNTKIKASVEFKILSTGLLLRDEVWAPGTGNPPSCNWDGINGVISQTINTSLNGTVTLSSISNPSIVYNLSVVNGSFYTTWDNNLLNAVDRLEGPILLQYKNTTGKLVMQRRVNKVLGRLTVVPLYATNVTNNTSACTDSDGGINYYVKGTITDGTKSFTDVCQDSNNLFEYDCGWTNGINRSEHNGLGGSNYYCPYGCSNGACNITNDTSAPLITSLGAISLTTNSARIKWLTNENSNSTVRYGKSNQLNLIAYSAAFVTSHSILLSNLSRSTIYTYAVTSCDISSNCAESSIRYFTTAPSYCSWWRHLFHFC